MKFLLLVFFSSFIASAQLNQSKYVCENTYNIEYEKSFGKNKSEISIGNDEGTFNSVGLFMGGVSGGLVATSVVTTIGASGIIFGLMGAFPVGIVGYGLATGIHHEIRKIRTNSYLKAEKVISHAVTFAHKNKNFTPHKLIEKIVKRLNRKGHNTSYEAVINKLAELANTNIFCREGELSTYKDLIVILSEKL